MHTQRDICGQQADGEAAGEGLQEHSGRSVRMVSEDSHQNIDHAECDANQYSEDNSIHGQACTLQRTAAQGGAH